MPYMHHVGMPKPTPLELLTSSHIAALIEVIRADSFVLGTEASEVESMSLHCITLAMHRLSCELNRPLLEGTVPDRISAVQLVLRESAALLDVAPIACCDAAPDLRLLERLCILVLDELPGSHQAEDHADDPF
jgi:hypothetical protein